MQKRKKIILFSGTVALGGIGKVVLNLAGGFMADGIDVDVVLTKRTGEYLPLFEAKNIHVTGLGCENHNAFPVRKLARYIAAQKPDAVIGMGGFQNAVAVGARFLSRTKTRLMITDHGTLSYSNLNPRSSFFRKTCILLAYRLCLVLFYRFADHIVALSKSSANSLKRAAWLGAQRIEVIYNPVVTSDLLIKAQQPSAHPWLQNKSQKVVLAVGRLHPIKDFATLIRAFHDVRQRMQCKLIILGDGPEKDNLAALADTLGVADDVDVVGFVENPYCYMSKADVFVLSSLTEGLPTVLIEAMACGCPVVSTDCPGGSSEILENGLYGPLVPVGNSVALANAVHNVLTGTTACLRENMLRRAQDFSLEKGIASYRNMLGL